MPARRNPQRRIDQVSIKNDDDRSVIIEDEKQLERQPEKPVIDKLSTVDPNQPINKYSFSFSKREYEEQCNLSMLH